MAFFVVVLTVFAFRVVGAAAATLRCAGKAIAAESCEPGALGGGR